MALPRPIGILYYNGKNYPFKKGRATTTERAIVAAVKTLADNPKKYARVYIFNGRGVEQAYLTNITIGRRIIISRR